MTATNRRVLLASAIVATALAVGWFSLVVLTPTFGTVVAYVNQQPPLRVVQPATASSTEEMEKMLRLAKLHFQNIPSLDQTYWPEPSLIEEHKECWLVAFTRKVPVYRFLGHEEILRPTDLAMFISITKSNYDARFGKWCQ
jgi:hypothetical protein